MLINPCQFYDTDAAAYIAAVQAADGQGLEDGVKNAINQFVLGCKADGIWSAIKASCILAGARMLNGAFYSIGESLDLAKLDTRITTLINTFTLVIP